MGKAELEHSFKHVTKLMRKGKPFVEEAEQELKAGTLEQLSLVCGGGGGVGCFNALSGTKMLGCFSWGVKTETSPPIISQYSHKEWTRKKKNPLIIICV